MTLGRQPGARLGRRQRAGLVDAFRRRARTGHRSGTLVFDGPSIGPAGRADFDGGYFRPHLLEAAPAPHGAVAADARFAPLAVVLRNTAGLPGLAALGAALLGASR
ncbi:hypothetical protein GCM10010399_67320 [Dactylosporangium fulvum]|uniref:Uncharacterized protein n=1 Tax=Dactylosporangium fulvum TaxID=53359 RepID=A0ABY5VP05_9ACTN|nr:hypothetical protein [Dactylosporangium fulvum]UWP78771.1 hypothetical protein Dfulv_26750 [Dactylosporangium fulvum]